MISETPADAVKAERKGAEETQTSLTFHQIQYSVLTENAIAK